jgi:hypothetical protein
MRMLISSVTSTITISIQHHRVGIWLSYVITRIVTKKLSKYGYEALFNLERASFESEYLKHFGYGLAYYYLSDTYSWMEKADSALYYSRLAIAENTIINNKDMIASAHNHWHLRSM